MELAADFKRGADVSNKRKCEWPYIHERHCHHDNADEHECHDDLQSDSDQSEQREHQWPDESGQCQWHEERLQEELAIYHEEEPEQDHESDGEVVFVILYGQQ